MIKFKITPERIQAVCSIPEYYGIMAKRQGSAMMIAPRLLVNEKGEYIMTAIYDEDGDVKEYQGLNEALQILANTPLVRLAAMMDELMKACIDIINPPSGGGLKSPPPSG